MNVQSQKENVVPTVRIQSTEEKEASNTNEMLTSQATKEAIPETSTPVGIKPISEADILQTVPRTYRTQAEGLLSWLTRNPKEVSWNHNGEVTIDGSALPGSSIADLVNDSLRLRNGFKPIGREAFAKTLAKINTSESIVRNDDIRKQMIRYKIEELPTLTPSPPEKVKQFSISNTTIFC